MPSGEDRLSPEVSEKPRRRSFDAAYKLRILAEADRCAGRGELGELLRREGLYSSHLSTWRAQRDEGILSGLTPRRRGRGLGESLLTPSDKRMLVQMRGKL